MSNYNLFSPTDYRYKVIELESFLTEEAFIKYKTIVEIALIKTLARQGVCSEKVAREVEGILDKVKAVDVYDEEKRIKHDIRAQVNVMKRFLSDEAKPFVHLTATSNDVVETARALMLKDAVSKVILPDLIELEKSLIRLARGEAKTIQIGRTHGQHAQPITFGFTIAEYVERLGERILKIKEASENLVGKFSGAVGAYNASSILIKDPEEFERQFLQELGLKQARISTQIVPAEPLTDFNHSIISCFSVLANLADDMRHLQRTEIGEVGEPFEKEQVGSSTMPQKRNPINFENVKSAWKTFMPRMITVYLDQISEHQRDLTNSLSQRFIPELLVVFDSSVKRIGKLMSRLTVDKKNMEKNFNLSSDKLIAEPLQILLSFHGFTEGHEKVRQLAMESYKTGKPLIKLVFADQELKPFIEKFSLEQKELISSPEKCVGIASKKTLSVCDYWEKQLSSLEKTIS
ncbi:MAG: lyase family protein [archaeon]